MFAHSSGIDLFEAELAEMVRAMHHYRAPAFGKVALVDGGGVSKGGTCEAAHLEHALLMYFDVEVDHTWMRMRFQEHYPPLRSPGLDPVRMRYYQYTMHLDLVGGPMRIAQGDFPDREWMLDLADRHLQKALAYSD